MGNDGLDWVVVVEIDGNGYIQVILKVELRTLTPPLQLPSTHLHPSPLSFSVPQCDPSVLTCMMFISRTNSSPPRLLYCPPTCILCILDLRPIETSIPLIPEL